MVAPTNTFVKFSRDEIEQSVSDRFEKIAYKYPERIAVRTKRSQLTYSELNDAANSVAWAILNQQSGRREQVALLLGNDISSVAAILGVLMAGKAYVPIDPSLPHARVSYILEDSQASLIITNNKNISLAKNLARDDNQLVNIDEIGVGVHDEKPDLNIPPDAPAWIIYTSGSTGQPKGVVQNHRNVLHFIMNYTNGFHICPDDRMTLLFSCSVNAGAHGIFSALLNGASLCLFDIKEEGISHLADWLIQQEITIYSSVPTVFLHLLDTLTGLEKFSNLRLIIMIGEPVYSSHAGLYKRHFSQNCIFVNRLGSTETGSIRWYFMDKQTQITGASVPVGYPVEDNEVFLMDDSGKAIGFDQVGEIAVKSRYLSPGYWRRPDLTQTVFLSDPAGGDRRTYRTGDLGRMMSDGCLIHLGRKDFQVKIRGYRIETAEIEIALLRHSDIKEAAVWIWGTQTDNQRLVAYIVPAGQKIPTVNELRLFLAEVLPDYMIPTIFMTINELPTAPNGKLDRRALPSPDRARPNLGTPFVAPRTPTENMLTEIWTEVLALDKIGIHDNFFDLGGNSLLATQIISRIIDIFQMKTPKNILLTFLLSSPTIADMAISVLQNLLDGEGGDMADLLDKVEELSGGESKMT